MNAPANPPKSRRAPRRKTARKPRQSSAPAPTQRLAPAPTQRLAQPRARQSLLAALLRQIWQSVRHSLTPSRLTVLILLLCTAAFAGVYLHVR